jgi:hypothetical protein
MVGLPWLAQAGSLGFQFIVRYGPGEHVPWFVPRERGRRGCQTDEYRQEKQSGGRHGGSSFSRIRVESNEQCDKARPDYSNTQRMSTVRHRQP